MGIVCEPSTGSASLDERVDELLRSHTGELLCTAGMHAAIVELVLRSEGHDEAIREVAGEIRELVAGLERLEALMAAN